MKPRAKLCLLASTVCYLLPGIATSHELTANDYTVHVADDGDSNYYLALDGDSIEDNFYLGKTGHLKVDIDGETHWAHLSGGKFGYVEFTTDHDKASGPFKTKSEAISFDSDTAWFACSQGNLFSVLTIGFEGSPPFEGCEQIKSHEVKLSD